MQGDYLLNGLVKRRSALAGALEATHKRIKALVADIDHLDATIRQFAPDFQIEAIRTKAFRPPRDWSHSGEMSRMVLDTPQRGCRAAYVAGYRGDHPPHPWL